MWGEKELIDGFDICPLILGSYNFILKIGFTDKYVELWLFY
jgi:hypothetical protein